MNCLSIAERYERRALALIEDFETGNSTLLPSERLLAEVANLLTCAAALRKMKEAA